MAANKTFSFLAILSVGLGIGANTAIYTFIDWFLLRSLPVAHPESLVVLVWQTPDGSGTDTVVHNLTGIIWLDGESGGLRAFSLPLLSSSYGRVRAPFSPASSRIIQRGRST